MNIEDVNRPTAIAAGMWVYIIGAFVFNILPVLVGSAADTLGLNAQQVGFLASADLIGAVCACIVSLFWIRRVNWRIGALVGMAILTVGNLVAGRMQTYESLALVRCCCGLGMGVTVAVGLASLSDVRNQERIFGILIVVQVALAAVCLLIFPHLAKRWGMAGIFNFLAAVSILSMLVLPYLVRRGIARDSSATGKAGRLFWPILASAGLMVFNISQGGVWAYSERIGNAIGLSAEYVGTILAIALIVGILGALAAAWLGDRISYLTVFLVLTVFEVISFLILSHSTSPIFFIVAVCVFNIMWNFAAPYTLTAIIKADQSGRFVVLIPAIQGLGIGLGPAVVAVFLTGESLLPVGYVGSAAIIICLIVYLPLVMSRKGMPNQP